jgi:hypothetical protein
MRGGEKRKIPLVSSGGVAAKRTGWFGFFKYDSRAATGVLGVLVIE